MALAHNPSIVRSGLVLHLDAANIKSYPRSGTTWTDLSGNGNNCTLTNGPTFNNANGGSIVFDGTNDIVLGPTFSTVLNYQTAGTIEIIFKIESAPIVDYPDLWGFDGSSRVIWLEAAELSTDIIRFVWRLSSGSLSAIATNIKPNTDRSIYQIVCMYETQGSNIIFSVYINGNLYQSITVVGSLTNSPTQILGIGGNPNSSNSVNCNIYNFKIYNRALSAAEVRQNFEALRWRYGI